MNPNPTTRLFDLLQFGEYGDVNPSVCDSATFTFLQAKTMLDTFQGDAEGCFLYSRHWNPSNKYLAERFREYGVKIKYPGLPDDPGHDTLRQMMDPSFGFGGLIAIDMDTADRAARLMELMEKAGVGYLAVSLGYFKTLFSNSGKSTSSEVPEEIQREMGLSEGLVRFSVGLDDDIELSWRRIRECVDRV
jgi:cystathionine beta-lyase/cystathionine gamma-synthase